MKGVVFDKKDGYAIIADNKGRFHKVKDDESFKVGQEYNSTFILSFDRYVIYKVSAILMAITIGTLGFAYPRPSYYVTLVSNPCVQLVSNVFGRGTGVKSLNYHGREISEYLSLSEQKIHEALARVIQAVKEQVYSKKGIAVTPSLDSSSAEEVKNTSENENLENTQVIMQKPNLEEFGEAGELGVSSGKMLLIDKPKAPLPEISAPDYANKPVKEILKSINGIKKENKVQDKELKSQKQKSELKENKNNDGQVNKKGTDNFDAINGEIKGNKQGKSNIKSH